MESHISRDSVSSGCACTLGRHGQNLATGFGQCFIREPSRSDVSMQHCKSTIVFLDCMTCQILPLSANQMLKELTDRWCSCLEGKSQLVCALTQGLRLRFSLHHLNHNPHEHTAAGIRASMSCLPRTHAWKLFTNCEAAATALAL